jgi:polysaccharide export outer membrane protein
MKPAVRMCMMSILVLVMFLTGCSQKGLGTIPSDESKGGERSEYIIGPEDVLGIHVWREQNLSATVTVRSDGKVSLPLINDVEAAGLTPLQLQEILINRLREFIDNPNITVVVQEANSYKVIVSGQVRTPGVQRLRSETTLLQIIPMAGGLGEWANPKKILIIRKIDGQERRFVVNYQKMLDGKIAPLVLKPGDMVIVP